MKKKLIKTHKYNLIHKIIILIIAQVLFVMAHPNFLFKNGLGFLAWFYYVPVFYLVSELKSKKEVLLYGFLYGVLSFGGYSYWLCNSYLAGFFAIIIGYGIIFSIVFILLKLSEYLSKNNPWILQCLIITCYEYVRTLGFAGFSYGGTAYTQWKNICFIQIADVIGNFGVGAILIFSSGIIYAFINKIIKKNHLSFQKLYEEEEIREYGKSSNLQRFMEAEIIEKKISLKLPLIFLFGFVVIVMASYVYGFISINSSKSDNKKITICAVQSDENPDSSGIDAYENDVEMLKRLTDEALDFYPEIEMVVWPETAVVPAIVYNYENKRDERRNRLSENLLEYIDSKSCQFVIGNGHKISDKNRIKVFNSALVFNPKENVLPPNPEIYSKNHLVPFTEYFPFEDRMPGLHRYFLKKGFQMWKPGESINVFSCKDFIYSTPICFEDTFSQVCRKMVLMGAKGFVNLTNDSWSKSLSCQNQHLAMAVFRSVENKVPTVRCTTNGQTCIIDSYGRITSKIDGFWSSYLVGTVDILPENRKMTVFTTLGDLFPLVACGILLFVLIIRIILVKIKKS